MPIKYFKKNKTSGFTLIELLVSIALFSLVLTAVLGSIMAISEANKKARSLMSVMNNLNFAVDGMTRSFKTGDISAVTGSIISTDARYHCFKTKESIISIGERDVEYCWDNQAKNLTKKIGANSRVPLTSSDIVIQHVEFHIPSTARGTQPILRIVIEGEVLILGGTSSKFTINTSVSQRKINI
jgi:prepilin-type N-terminal cleavage/methylation domain-containing protein